MAHLWMKNDSGQWAVLPLAESAFVLTTNPPSPLRDQTVLVDGMSRVVLLSQKRANETSWILIAGRTRSVRINGEEVSLGVQAIADRDEILIDEVGTLYFSDENLARIEPFPGSAESLYCPRCKQVLEDQSAAVNCPQCRTWYHQAEELPCWSYAETCALCPQQTDFETGFRWTPEDL